MSTDGQTLINATKDVANILFFIVVGTITVLSYVQARRTLFAPIRTETFKLQLKLFEEILAYFQHRLEGDFADSFDLPTMLSLNSYQMADAYVTQFPGQDKD